MPPTAATGRRRRTTAIGTALASSKVGITRQSSYTCTMQLGATPQALAELPALVPGQYFLRVATATGITTQKLTHN